MEAITRAASRFAEAATMIANKEVAALSALQNGPRLTSVGKSGGTADFLSAQIRANHDAIEKSIAEIRAASDATRQCWYDIVQEFENCARDNLNSIETQLRQSNASPFRTTPVQRAKSAAE